MIQLPLFSSNVPRNEDGKWNNGPEETVDRLDICM